MEDGVGTGVWSRKARLQLMHCATSVVCALISEFPEFQVMEEDGVLWNRNYSVETLQRKLGGRRLIEARLIWELIQYVN